MLRYRMIDERWSIKTDLLEISIVRVDGNKAFVKEKYGNGEVNKGADAIRHGYHKRVSILHIPRSFDLTSPRGRTFMQNVIAGVLRHHADEYIPKRVRLIADTHGLSYKRITIKNMRSRWGSCSSLRNLNFSVFLMLMPSSLIDYVICHELAHLTHLNHSSAFWAETDRLLGSSHVPPEREINQRAKELFSPQK